MNTSMPPVAKATQSDLIFTALLMARGAWVSMRKLGNISRSRNVHSRIAELRSDRCVRIENRVSGNRPRMSWYRLVASN